MNGTSCPLWDGWLDARFDRSYGKKMGIITYDRSQKFFTKIYLSIMFLGATRSNPTDLPILPYA